MKLGLLFSDFFAKMKQADGSMILMEHKIMKPPESVGKKRNCTRLHRVPAVSLISDRFWTVSYFQPHKIKKPKL